MYRITKIDPLVTKMGLLRIAVNHKLAFAYAVENLDRKLRSGFNINYAAFKSYTMV